jgi:hypothetical protein
MPTELVLRLEDFQSPERWRWVLCDPKGAVLATHAVALDASDETYGGFVDLHRWLEDRASPEDHASRHALTARVGAWLGEHVLGPVGPVLVERGTPVVVRVQVPYEASALLHRPFDLAHVGGEPLALQGVSLVFEVRALAGARKRSAGDRVRMLAVFSALPDIEAPLGLRRQRRAMSRLVEEIRRSRSRSLELRVLHGGVTRDRLRAALEDREGWDAIHVFGHGLAGGLLLEPPQAEPGVPRELPSQTTAKDLLAMDDLARMLRSAKDRLKLVVLSGCDPEAALTEARRWLGIPEPARVTTPPAASARAPGEKLSILAERLVREIGCAALVMRYPTSDDFGIELSVALYRLLFDRGCTLPEALSAALQDAWGHGERRDLDPIVRFAPVLFGPLESAPAAPLACSLTLLAPKALLGSQPDAPDLRGVPAEPPHFVGRTGPMARAAAALAPGSAYRAVLFHGMVCAGKTTCAAELVHGYARDSFRHIGWYKAPDEGADLAGAIASFAALLEELVPGLELVPAIDDEPSLELAVPDLSRNLGLHAVLVVIDNLESLLTPDGAFRDPRWAALVGAMIGHDGPSRLILTSRIVPVDLAADARVLGEPLHALGLGESLLLAREWPNLGALLRGASPARPGDPAPIGQDEARALVRRVLAGAQGHPKLLELVERQARTPPAVHELLDEGGSPADGEAFLARGETSLEAKDFLATLRQWTRRLTAALPEQERKLLCLLSCLEEADRTSEIVDASWARLGTRLGWPVSGSGVSVPDARVLVDVGLIAVLSEKEGRTVFAVDPVMAEVGRAEAGEAFAAAVDEELGTVWVMVCKHALGDERGRLSRQVVDAARRGTPYLMRRERWKDASRLLQTMLLEGPDRVLVSEALPRLRRIADATRGTPWGLAATGVLADAVLRSIGMSAEHSGADVPPIVSSRVPEAERLLREVLEAALAAGDSELASGAAGSLASLLRASGRAEEALQVVEAASRP